MVFSDIAADVLIGIIGALHVYIFYLESLIWVRERQSFDPYIWFVAECLSLCAGFNLIYVPVLSVFLCSIVALVVPSVTSLKVFQWLQVWPQTKVFTISSWRWGASIHYGRMNSMIKCSLSRPYSVAVSLDSLRPDPPRFCVFNVCLIPSH